MSANKLSLAQLGMALVTGVALGVTFFQHVTPSVATQSLAGVLLALVVFVTRSIISPLLVGTISVVIVAFAIEVLRQWMQPQIDAEWLLVILLVVAFVVLMLLPRDSRKRLSYSEVTHIVLVSIVFSWLSRRVPWSSEAALGWISATQEDNGTWLDGVARIAARDAALDVSEPVLGGSLAAVFGSLFVSLVRKLTDLTGTDLDTAVLTLRMYWFVTAAAVVAASRIVFVMLRRTMGWWASVPATIAVVVATLFAQGMHTFGHFTALFAASMIIVSLVYFIDVSHKRLVSTAVGILMLWAIANAWYPLHGFMLIAVTIFVLTAAVRFVHRRNHKSKYCIPLIQREKDTRFLYWGIGVVVLGAVVVPLALIVVPIAQTFLDISYVKYQLTLGGGHATVDVRIAVLVLSAVLANSSSLGAIGDLGRSTVIGLTVFVTALVAAGFIISPFEPQYAAYKSLHLATMALSPLAISALMIGMQRLITIPWRVGLTSAIVFVLGTLSYWQPYPQFSVLMREPEYAWWTTAAAQELSQRPERLLLCLDSRGENWGGYTSYVCSRQLAGLQGATADTTKIWTAAQLCQVTSAQIAGFADTFWDNVTLIVTDNSRLVSSVDCDGFGWAGPNLPRNSKYPIGYLSTVNWKSVRVVDRDGREVVKSFDYLRNETGFSDEIVNALEKSLQRDPVS